MAVNTTENKVHTKQSLDDTIYILSNEETPFVSGMERSKASAKKEEWNNEELAPVNLNNSLPEGGLFEDTAMTVPTISDNYTQTIYKVNNVSGSLDAVSITGGKRESARQKINSGKALARDVEAINLSNQEKRAGGGTGPTSSRLLRGARRWISSNVVSGAITEANLRKAILDLYKVGGKASKLFVSPENKTLISDTFTGNREKQQIAGSTTITNNTDMYRGDFGTLDVVTSLYVDDEMLLIDPKLWALKVLRPMTTEELGKQTDSTRVAMYTELTLQSKNEKGNAKIDPSV